MKSQYIAALTPRLSLLSAALLAAIYSGASAQPISKLSEVTVWADRFERTDSVLNENQIARRRAFTSDAARLIEDAPGISLYTAGGVSSLPVINGLADDRLRIKVDGMDLIASCPNHMNSPLSYVDPTQLESIQVYPGVASVSVGGDSIGGSVVAKSASPDFATPGEGMLQKGVVGFSYRNNGEAKNINLGATIASESVSLSYKASSAEAGNYKAGENFKSYTQIRPAVPVAGVNYGSTLSKDEVGSSAYQARNQLLTLALKGDKSLIEASYGYQDIPYEMYPNQRMDMIGNKAERYNLRYQSQWDKGQLELRGYHEEVNHHMDFGADKVLYYGSITGSNSVVYPVNGMPMNTTGRTDGISATTELEFTETQLARLGAQWQQYRLNDWWPPSPDCGAGNCTGGMAPNTFWNIADGKRDRQAIFGEIETRWNAQWFSQLGLRLEQINTNVGAAAGYNTGMYVGSAISSTGGAAAYNAQGKNRSDSNIDWSAIGRYTPDSQRTFEIGLAQKTRSPNLYERYAWSTHSMAMEMVNFVGDGNGYVGNPSLKPEVAHTVSLTGDWRGAENGSQFTVTPFYTHVQDYIDASRSYPGAAAANLTATTGFVKLQYVNQEARLYGLNMSGRMPLATSAMGQWSLKGLLNFTSGKNLTTGDSLYNVMPANARITLQQKLDSWENSAEIVAVAAKSEVSATRNEVPTPSYGLLNLRASYSHKQLQLDFGVENVLNKMYYQPLGGAYVAQGYTMSFNREVGTNNASAWGTGVPGMGRSFYAGLSYKF